MYILYALYIYILYILYIYIYIIYLQGACNIDTSSVLIFHEDKSFV